MVTMESHRFQADFMNYTTRFQVEFVAYDFEDALSECHEFIEELAKKQATFYVYSMVGLDTVFRTKNHTLPIPTQIVCRPKKTCSLG